MTIDPKLEPPMPLVTVVQIEYLKFMASPPRVGGYCRIKLEYIYIWPTTVSDMEAAGSDRKNLACNCLKFLLVHHLSNFNMSLTGSVNAMGTSENTVL